VINNKPS